MDPLSIAASILSVADVGLRVATKLYTYSNTALRAPKTVRALAQEVSLTAAILSDLGTLLQADGAARLASPNAISTTSEAVRSCERVFQEIGAEFEKAGGGIGYRKWIWPFLEDKVRVMLSDLERGKTLMLLMLNVITFAKQVSEEKPSKVAIEEQRILIIQLQKQNEQSIKQYEYIKQTLVNVALNTLQPSKDVDDFNPPKHSLTGDTTIGAATTAPRLPNGKGNGEGGATCLCGLVTGTSAAYDAHMMLEELDEYTAKLDGLLGKLQISRRQLGGVILSPSFGCEETRRKLDSLIEDLELVLVWQISALIENHTQVSIQEPTIYESAHESVETRILDSPAEHRVDSIPFERTRSRRWSPKQWVSQIIHPGRSRKNGAASHSAPSSATFPGSATWPASGASPYTANEPIISLPEEHDNQTTASKPGELNVMPVSAGGLAAPISKIGLQQKFEPEADSEVVNRLLKDWTTLDDSEIKRSEVDPSA